MKLLLAAALLFAVPATAQTPNLGGTWQAMFTLPGGSKIERVTIRQDGNRIEATKQTGDDFVPAGTMNLRGTYDGPGFDAEQLCASTAHPDDREWLKVKVQVLDADHLVVTGSCSAAATWHRTDGPLPEHPETHIVLRPSTEPFAADIERFVQDLEAIVEKASNTPDKARGASMLQGVQAMQATQHAAGRAGDLSEPMKAFIAASSRGQDSEAALAALAPRDRALAAYVRHDYPLALKLWLPLAEKGDVEAQLDAALMHAGGINGAVRDDDQAFRWLRRAAAQGAPLGMESLAAFYGEGRGTARDPVAAWMWLTLAAEGYRDAPQKDWAPAAMLKRRDAIAAGMSADEIARAQALVTRCRDSRFKNCR